MIIRLAPKQDILITKVRNPEENRRAREEQPKAEQRNPKGTEVNCVVKTTVRSL